MVQTSNEGSFPPPWKADGASIYDATGNRIANCDPAVAEVITNLYNENPVAIFSNFVPVSTDGKNCGVRHYKEVLFSKQDHSCAEPHLHTGNHKCPCGYSWGYTEGFRL